MAQKTTPTVQTVQEFLREKVTDVAIRQDCDTLITLMQEITGKPATMWGASIIGFDQYHYKYESGHEGYMCITGFSPRKPAITIYVMPGTAEHDTLLAKLGKFKAGKGCLYVKKLADINLDILKQLVAQSVAFLKQKYP